VYVRRSSFPLPTNYTDDQMEDTRPVYPLPRITIVGTIRQKVYPGIKELPEHIRTNFRNTFIRVVIRNVFSSNQPWSNPDLQMLQLAYDKVFPSYPARLRCNDAIFHPVTSTLLCLQCDELTFEIRPLRRSALFGTALGLQRCLRSNAT